MDAQSHILNGPEWTSLLDSQVYFEELDLGLKKLHKRGDPSKKGQLVKRDQNEAQFGVKNN